MTPRSEMGKLAAALEVFYLTGAIDLQRDSAIYLRQRKALLERVRKMLKRAEARGKASR